MAALESGRVGSYRQAAEVFGVSERSVGTWWRECGAGGCRAPAVPVKARTGPGERLGSEDRVVVFRAMADHTPEDLLLGGPLRTHPLVCELTGMVTGVVTTEQGVGKRLPRHGFTHPKQCGSFARPADPPIASEPS
ncbi:hypothetical protein ACFWB2_43445 [Streptomyces virginiae]|uniref:hypothetical protein n=1 Tax=Streptomyces virginiae TaxID=1961 RepID=UPI0036A41D28